tara:strand:- start:1147 stop:1428 length:282 start_codon:yes stop_codon:yes gene_type:complete
MNTKGSVMHMSDVCFKDDKGAWHVYHEKQCKRCGCEGALYGSVTHLGDRPAYVEEGTPPKGEVFLISGGIYVGLHVCADCASGIYGTAKIKNL